MFYRIRWLRVLHRNASFVIHCWHELILQFIIVSCIASQILLLLYQRYRHHFALKIVLPALLRLVLLYYARMMASLVYCK